MDHAIPTNGARGMAALSAAMAILLIVGAGRALADDLVGVPRIIDGDTVQIAGTKVRLEGIDAPEMAQFCLDDKSQAAECGKGVREALIQKSAGRLWTCRVSGQDIYRRSLATCYVGGEDIQKWMVRSGYALSFKRYSHAYDADEVAAREARAGLWSGAFIAPWDWRSRNKATEILGAVSVPIDGQKILLKPEARSALSPAAPLPAATRPAKPAAHTTSRHGPCQNPDDRATNGSRCGNRSASSREHKG